ncbi:hypothetical protein AC579_5286 [Pseudocercospora musae]|uniref:Uncharacterized protein n=1 Tax=Pseudocercospora musae TaxID=113226 RepID=A0A139IPK1_9PEZI|nr:hypothetical protein AC579_5286 [Pseudocercospora musae]
MFQQFRHHQANGTVSALVVLPQAHLEALANTVGDARELPHRDTIEASETEQPKPSSAPWTTIRRRNATELGESPTTLRPGAPKKRDPAQVKKVLEQSKEKVATWGTKSGCKEENRLACQIDLPKTWKIDPLVSIQEL